MVVKVHLWQQTRARVWANLITSWLPSRRMHHNVEIINLASWLERRVTTYYSVPIPPVFLFLPSVARMYIARVMERKKGTVVWKGISQKCETFSMISLSSRLCGECNQLQLGDKLIVNLRFQTLILSWLTSVMIIIVWLSGFAPFRKVQYI